MKEIVERLTENRQIERAKSILESNGYKVSKETKRVPRRVSRRLNESTSLDWKEYASQGSGVYYMAQYDRYNLMIFEEYDEDSNPFYTISIEEKDLGEIEGEYTEIAYDSLEDAKRAASDYVVNLKTQGRDISQDDSQSSKILQEIVDAIKSAGIQCKVKYSSESKSVSVYIKDHGLIKEASDIALGILSQYDVTYKAGGYLTLYDKSGSHIGDYWYNEYGVLYIQLSKL